MTNSFSAKLNKCNAEKKNNSPCAVIVLGKYDTQHAMGKATQSLLLQIAKTHYVVVKIIDDASNFGTSIRDACANLKKKASVLVVVTHGRSHYLRFGPDIPWYRLQWKSKPLYQKKDVAPEDFSHLTQDAKIFLLSCLSGQGIAQAVSDVSKRVVFAPMRFISDAGICLQNLPNPEIKMLAYDEHNEQQMGIFMPGHSSVFIPSIGMLSNENKESFSAMAQYLRKQAENGDADAQLQLGSFYLSGKGGCEKSEREAMRWVFQAAQQGHARAQYVVGCCYLSGKLGIEKSETKAIEWFKRSASQAFALALFQMGIFFLHGQCGVTQSDEEAFKLFSLAAQYGMAQADYCLGFMYEHGRGSGICLKYAKTHYKIAEEHGISEAKLRLANLLFQEERQLLGFGGYYLNKLYVLSLEFFEQIKLITLRSKIPNTVRFVFKTS